MQRAGDPALPYYYTLNSGGTIDSKLENMETMSSTDGSVIQGGFPAMADIAGKILWSSGGTTPSWNLSAWFHLTPPNSQNPNWSPWGEDPSKWPWNPDAPAPDPDPFFTRMKEHSGIKIPERPRKTPGDSPGPGQMAMTGYNQPALGLGDVPSGTFMAAGAYFTNCTIPPGMQPCVPPGGLLGPDCPIPGWANPGYTPPPNISSPILPNPPGGWHVTPITKPPFDPTMPRNESPRLSIPPAH